MRMSLDKLHLCGDFNEQINNAERKLIPHLKRFMECVAGDSEFYSAVQKNAAGCTPLLESKGIFGVDPIQAAALIPETAPVMSLLKEIPAIPTAELEDKPQALLWRRYTDAVARYRETWRHLHEKTPSSAFNAWRQRQINRCHSQLSRETNQAIVHTAIAFELCKGCSMGCHFCGVGAEPLQMVYRYTAENAKLWRDVLDVAVERLGAAAGGGVCYWATEPSDNPDYFKFVADFGEKTGIYPQTTTAAPLRNLDWTREMLQFRREHSTAMDSFSILSLNTLHRVHDIFSAEDLALTALAMQHTEPAVRSRAQSGRNRKVGSGGPQPGPSQDHTIACLSGYLVNMAECSVRLISPCPPSGRWPLGYRIYAEGSFSSASELNDFISKTINNCMPEQIAPDDILAFRLDLKFIPSPDEEGFKLLSKYRLHKITGAPHLARLGELIAQGNLISRRVLQELMVQHQDVLAIMASMQKIFDQGLLEDGFSDKEAAGRQEE